MSEDSPEEAWSPPPPPREEEPPSGDSHCAGIRPRTFRLGAGLLVGLGIFTLLGGGVCVGAQAQMRGEV